MYFPTFDTILALRRPPHASEPQTIGPLRGTWESPWEGAGGSAGRQLLPSAPLLDHAVQPHRATAVPQGQELVRYSYGGLLNLGVGLRPVKHVRCRAGMSLMQAVEFHACTECSPQLQRPRSWGQAVAHAGPRRRLACKPAPPDAAHTQA
jgi:hypothetical protein